MTAEKKPVATLTSDDGITMKRLLTTQPGYDITGKKPEFNPPWNPHQAHDTEAPDPTIPWQEVKPPAPVTEPRSTAEDKLDRDLNALFNSLDTEGSILAAHWNWGD